MSSLPNPELVLGAEHAPAYVRPVRIRCEDHENVRTTLIRDEVIGKSALERCDICGRYYATTLFLEYVRQREGSHPYEKELHHHCPDCAKVYSKRNRSDYNSTARKDI